MDNNIHQWAATILAIVTTVSTLLGILGYKAVTKNGRSPPQQQGTPLLEVESNIHGGKSTYGLTKPVINIGRDLSNDIVIDAPVVSAFHAQIQRQGNQLILVHPHPSQSHTTNGLLYQNCHIQGNASFHKPLVCGDVFYIGKTPGPLVTLTYNDTGYVPSPLLRDSIRHYFNCSCTAIVTLVLIIAISLTLIFVIMAISGGG